MNHIHQDLQPTSPAAVGETDKHLTFVSGDTSFAIGILKIKEIIEFRHLTQVPMMPACMRGVISLRGVVVPVIDLQARFTLVDTPVSSRTCIVIVEIDGVPEVGHQVLGIMVDEVSAVLDIASQDIAPPPPLSTDESTNFLQGVAQVDGKFVLLLDVDKVLSIEEMSALSDAAAPT